MFLGIFDIFLHFWFCWGIFYIWCAIFLPYTLSFLNTLRRLRGSAYWQVMMYCLNSIWSNPHIIYISLIWVIYVNGIFHPYIIVDVSFYLNSAKTELRWDCAAWGNINKWKGEFPVKPEPAWCSVGTEVISCDYYLIFPWWKCYW